VLVGMAAGLLSEENIGGLAEPPYVRHGDRNAMPRGTASPPTASTTAAREMRR
jgi:hypothetical protein